MALADIKAFSRMYSQIIAVSDWPRLFCTIGVLLSIYVIAMENTVVWKFFNRRYSIDEKFKVKYFHGCMTSSKYFYLYHISLAIILMFVIATMVELGIDPGKLLLLIATTL